MDYKKYFRPNIPSDSPELRAPKLQEGEAGQQGGAVQREEVPRGGHRQVPLQVHTQSPVSPPPACWRRSGYMMTGSPVSWCGSDGSWSPAWALVSCSRSCSYPGATIHGTINPVHFYYSPGQTVTYTCSEVSPWSPGHHRHLLCPGLPAGGQACAHVRRGRRLGRGAAQVCRQESLNMVSPQTSG